MSTKFRFILAFSTAILAANGASAQALSPNDRYIAATQLLLDVLGPQAEFRTPPAKTDPMVALSLSEMRATMDVFGTDAFPIDGMNTFQSICAPLNRISVQYAMAGANGLGLKSNPSTAAAKVAALENANSVKYQDEMTSVADESTKCFALHLPFVAGFWESLPAGERTQVRIDGLRQMQHGVTEVLLGLATMATQPAYTKTNRQMAVTTIATYDDVLAAALSVADRKALLIQIRRTAPGLATAYPKEYASLVNALSQTSCSGLCTVQ